MPLNISERSFVESGEASERSAPFSFVLPEERNGPDQFLPVREGDIRGVVHERWRNRLGDIGTFLDNLEANPGTILRDGGGQGITSRLDLKGETVFCKIYSATGFVRWLRDLLGMGRAMREWKANCDCEALGIRTARVEMALTRRRGLRFTHYVLTALAPGVETSAFLPTLGDDEPRRRMFLRRYGRLIATLHERGLFHAHLSFKHTFFTPEWEVTVIDLERSMIRRPLPKRKIEKNLRQVRRRLAMIVPPDEIEEFERGYCGEPVEGPEA